MLKRTDRTSGVSVIRITALLNRPGSDLLALRSYRDMRNYFVFAERLEALDSLGGLGWWECGETKNGVEKVWITW